MISAREAWENTLNVFRDAELEYIEEKILKAIALGNYSIEISKRDIDPRRDTIDAIKALGYHFSQSDKAFFISWKRPVLKTS